jgi:hypothetical protein
MVAAVQLATIAAGKSRCIHENPKSSSGRMTRSTTTGAPPKKTRWRSARRLKKTGFLNDRGTSVLLWMGGGPTVVSFVLDDGRVGPSASVFSNFHGNRTAHRHVGGRLSDSGAPGRRPAKHPQENERGQGDIGARDVVYYFGDATDSRCPRARRSAAVRRIFHRSRRHGGAAEGRRHGDFLRGAGGLVEQARGRWPHWIGWCGRSRHRSAGCRSSCGCSIAIWISSAKRWFGRLLTDRRSVRYSGLR